MKNHYESSKCPCQGKSFTLWSLPYYTREGNKSPSWTFLLRKLIIPFFIGMLLQCIKQCFTSVKLLLLIEFIFSFTEIAEYKLQWEQKLGSMHHRVKASPRPPFYTGPSHGIFMSNFLKEEMYLLNYCVLLLQILCVFPNIILLTYQILLWKTLKDYAHSTTIQQSEDKACGRWRYHGMINQDTNAKLLMC